MKIGMTSAERYELGCEVRLVEICFLSFSVEMLSELRRAGKEKFTPARELKPARDAHLCDAVNVG